MSRRVDEGTERKLGPSIVRVAFAVVFGGVACSSLRFNPNDEPHLGFAADGPANKQAAYALDRLARTVGFAGSLAIPSPNPIFFAAVVKHWGIEVSVTQLPDKADLQRWQAIGRPVPVRLRLVENSFNTLRDAMLRVQSCSSELIGLGLDAVSCGLDLASNRLEYLTRAPFTASQAAKAREIAGPLVDFVYDRNAPRASFG